MTQKEASNNNKKKRNRFFTFSLFFFPPRVSLHGSNPSNRCTTNLRRVETAAGEGGGGVGKVAAVLTAGFSVVAVSSAGTACCWDRVKKSLARPPILMPSEGGVDDDSEPEPEFFNERELAKGFRTLGEEALCHPPPLAPRGERKAEEDESLGDVRPLSRRA